MSGLFGSKHSSGTSPTPEVGVKVQSSCYGNAIPVFYGVTRIAPNIVWMANFTAIAHTQKQGKGGGGGCFVAGTKIATPDGDRPIEELRAGDRIYCCNEAYEIVEGTIRETHEHATAESGDKMLRVRSGERALYITRGHYVYVGGLPTADGNGLPIRAEQLTPGVHQLASFEGQLCAIDAVEDAPDVGSVYNLTVDPYTNYFAEGFLVHNGGGGQKTTTYTYTVDIIWCVSEGPIVLTFGDVISNVDGPVNYLLRTWRDKGRTTAADSNLTNFQVGFYGDPENTSTVPLTSPWSYLVANYPSQAVGYSGFGMVGANPLNLGDNANLPNMAFECWRDGLRDGHNSAYLARFDTELSPWPDTMPDVIAYDILTNLDYGLGFGPQVGNIPNTLQEVAFSIPNGAADVPYQFHFRLDMGGNYSTLPNTNPPFPGPAGLPEMPPIFDRGVTDPNTGQVFRLVAGTPTEAGTYAISSNLEEYMMQPITGFFESDAFPVHPQVVYIFKYIFAPADAGRVVQITYTPGSNYGIAKTFLDTMQIRISPAYMDQRSGADVLQEIATLCHLEWVWSCGMLQLWPRADGLNAVVSLTDDDFLPNQGGSTGSDDPVQVTRTRLADQINHVQFEVLDRNNDYAPTVVMAFDQALIDTYGRRPSGSIQAHMFANAYYANNAAQLYLAKQHIRNNYTFTLDARYIWLDPMDIVALSDAQMGLNNATVRITEITENDDGTLTVTAEEYPSGIGSGISTFNTTTPIGQGFNVDPNNVDPGNANAPVMFMMPTTLTNGVPTAGIAISGSGAYWGGAEIYVSLDGVTYSQIGTQTGASRMGVLTASFGTSSDPDTTVSFSINTTESKATLTSATSTVADSYGTLSLIDNEFVAYSNANLTSAYHYTMDTYIRRGIYGSPIGSHASGASFVRVDSQVFEYAVPPSMIGQTVFVKLASFNIFGNALQDLAGLPVYTFTPTAPLGGGIFQTVQYAPDWIGTLSGFVRHYTGVLYPDSTVLASAMTDVQLWNTFVYSPVASPTFTGNTIDLGANQSVTVEETVSSALGPGVSGTASVSTTLDYWVSGAGDPATYNNWTSGTVVAESFKARVGEDSTHPTIISKFAIAIHS